MLETTRVTLGRARGDERGPCRDVPARGVLNTVRILVLTQYFTPEVGATSTRLHAFAAGLASRGHDVHVVCEVPNHPQGVIHEGFKGGAGRRRTLDGVHVTYVWVHTRAEKSSRDRLLFYVSYAAMATAAGALLPRPDVILASSPPLFVGAAATALARIHRVPWVLDVRDLWPDAAVALGELGSGPALVARSGWSASSTATPPRSPR